LNEAEGYHNKAHTLYKRGLRVSLELSLCLIELTRAMAVIATEMTARESRLKNGIPIVKLHGFSFASYLPQEFQQADKKSMPIAIGE
jgi:hypothetical protein